MALPLEKFIELTNILVLLGENKKEMQFWRNVYASLQPEEQEEIATLLQKEHDALKRATKQDKAGGSLS